MTPLDFLRWYEHDEAIGRERSRSAAPLGVEEGERVGVVLFHLGGPETLDDVESYLYTRFADPARTDWPVGGRLRHWAAQIAASVRASSVREQYEVIGGESPLPRLMVEQAESLQRCLNETYGSPSGIDFRTYPATRYGHPFIEEAAAQMNDEDVDRVVLLPLHPQFARATSGASLSYWTALEETGEIPSWPTTAIREYAANPKYVRALSERIDEGLQRFPHDRREEVQLLFSAPAVPARDVNTREDPYCCLVHATVDRVLAHREDDREFQVAFQTTIGVGGQLSPTTSEALQSLSEPEGASVLVVPTGFVSDQLQTSFGLDIEMRKEAERAGVAQYEVASALNTHPLFIEALSEAAVAQLDLPVDVNQLRVGGDGLAQDYPLRPPDDMPRYVPGTRAIQCGRCPPTMGARKWAADDELDSEIVQGQRREEASTVDASDGPPASS